MYNLKIGNKSFDIIINGDEIKMDGSPLKYDIVHLENDRYHMIINNKSYNLEVVKYDLKTKKAIIKINNEEVEVEVKTEMDKLLAKMGLNNNHTSVAKDVGAPMPGLILDVFVNIGDEVKTGDKLLVLEAMKMENIIKSPGDGRIKSIIISKGESVDSGQKLIHFE